MVFYLGNVNKRRRSHGSKLKNQERETLVLVNRSSYDTTVGYDIKV